MDTDPHASIYEPLQQYRSGQGFWLRDDGKEDLITQMEI